MNLVLNHSMLTPRARWRSLVVRYGPPLMDHPHAQGRRPAGLRHVWTWVALMYRVSALDVHVHWMSTGTGRCAHCVVNGHVTDDTPLSLFGIR